MRPNEQDNQLIWNRLTEAKDHDRADQTSLDPLEILEAHIDRPDPELSRVPPGKGLDNDDNDDKPRGAEVGDFEKELVDLYWTVVDSGVDESLAGDWFDGVRLSLSELLASPHGGRREPGV